MMSRPVAGAGVGAGAGATTGTTTGRLGVTELTTMAACKLKDFRLEEVCLFVNSISPSRLSSISLTNPR